MAALVAGSCECNDTIARRSPVATARSAKPGLAKLRPWVFVSHAIPYAASCSTTVQKPG
jgi:hypothetical protein